MLVKFFSLGQQATSFVENKTFDKTRLLSQTINRIKTFKTRIKHGRH
jgi:hypothetical protein